MIRRILLVSVDSFFASSQALILLFLLHMKVENFRDGHSESGPVTLLSAPAAVATGVGWRRQGGVVTMLSSRLGGHSVTVTGAMPVTVGGCGPARGRAASLSAAGCPGLKPALPACISKLGSS